MNNHMRVRELSLSYDQTPILKNINLDIPQGRITAIIGPSGCGKSTFLRSLNRMTEEEPTSHLSGEILLKERRITDMNKEEVCLLYTSRCV